MSRALAAALLVACGPSVGVDGDDDGTTSATTTSSETSATSPGSSTGATTATTQPTTVSSTEGDGTTSIDPATSGEDGETVDTGFSFINRDIHGTGTIECDVWAQDCARGDKCLPWSNDGGAEWNAVICSPIHPAPAGIGEPCHVEDSPYSGVDDCELGAMCWGVDPTTLIGECVPICDGNEANPMCGDGASCLIAFEGTVIVCLPSCDPFAPECGEGTDCIGEASNFPYPTTLVCLPVPQFQPQGYGERCQSYSFEVCEVGLFCVNAEDVPGCSDGACCTVLGESASPPVCPDETQTCIPFDDAMPDDGLCYCGVES